MKKNCVILLLLIVVVCSAQISDTASGQISGQKGNFDTLSGPLPKLLRNIGKPYFVTADIEVPADQTVTIEPGVVLLFRDFAGLHVQGRLVALGSRMSPIVFTSEFDTTYNKNPNNFPNPFDWNGIYIHTGGIGTSLEYCNVFYSVYGIKTDTKFIRISTSILRENGKGNFSVDGAVVETTEPFTYVLDMKDATVDGVPINILRDPLAPRRNIFRYMGLVLAVAGAGCSGYFGWQAWEAEKDFKPLRSNDDSNLRENSEARWSNARDLRNSNIVYTSVSGTGLLLGLTGFVWTFTF